MDGNNECLCNYTIASVQEGTRTGGQEDRIWYILLIVGQEVAAEKIAGPGLALTRQYLIVFFLGLTGEKAQLLHS
jgi:hypothetical protein